MKPPEPYQPATRPVRPASAPVYRPGGVSPAQQKPAPATTAPPVYRPVPPVLIQRSAPKVFRPGAGHTLMMKPGVVQRTVADAAKTLFDGGFITVKKAMLTPRFCKDNGVEKTDLAAIQGALDTLRSSAPAKKVTVIPDVTVPGNRPTTGGMVEEDATKLAALNSWTQVTASFTCTDPSHSPKGKLYTDGTNYYGADNTGHVGWGFKVWTKKNKTTLNYAGNYTWGGTAWGYHARGT